MGLTFSNPIGLAAGFDKRGALVREMEALGFGAIEIGTVTPRPEPEHNPGVAALVATVSSARNGGDAPRRIVQGISIGMNSDTPRERATDDYLAGLRAVWKYADYVAVNLSAPAARYLGEPRWETSLSGLLARLKDEQAVLESGSARRLPLAVKIGLDPCFTDVPAIVRHVRDHHFDAIVAAVGPGDRGADPAGPAGDRATREHGTRSVRLLASFLEGSLAVISVGGILSPEDAAERLDAGASLVQLYRGFANGGPDLVRQIIAFLADAEAAPRPPRKN